MVMKTNLPAPVNQRVFGAVLIVLFALLILFKELYDSPPGPSRLAWPDPASVKP